MASWFRSWHGAPSDPKWRVVARVAEADLVEVIGLAWYLLDVASQHRDRGSIDGHDADSIGEATGLAPAAVTRIVKAMHVRNILSHNRFVAWDDRQPKREDNSAERVTRHRERVGNAAQRTVTHCNAPEEKRRETETEETQRGTPPTPSPVVAAPVQVEQAAPTVVPATKLIDLRGERVRQGEYENELFQAVFEACGLDETCSDAAWKGVQKVVASFASRGRDGPFIRSQTAWFAAEHWKGRQGELPSPGDLLDTAVQFERGVKRKKADNGFTTRSDRNLANLAEIAEHFGLSEIAGNGGGDHEGGHLLGPGDPVEVGAVGDGLGLARGHRQTNRAD